MSKRIPLALIFSVFFVPPLFVLGIAGLIFSFGILACLRRGYHITTPLSKFVSVFLALTLISAFMNWTDPISTGMFLGFHLLPVAGFWGVVQLGCNDLSINRAIRWMGWFVLIQVPAFCLQWYLAGARGLTDISYDLFAGSIARSEISTHTAGVVMMFAMVISFSLFHTTRRRFYLWAAVAGFAGWILSATGHSYVAFMVGAVIFAVYEHKNRLLRTFVRAVPAVAIVCLAIIYTRAPIFQVIQDHFFYPTVILESDKFKAYERTFSLSYSFEEIPRWNSLIGVGPGMYTSRGASMKTGKYFRGRTYSFFPFPESSQFTDTALRYQTKSSIGNAPWSSLISLWGEVGPGVVIIIFLIFFAVFRMAGRVKNATNDPFFKGLSEGVQLCSILYLLIMGIENWLEFPKVAAFFWVLVALVYCHGFNARRAAALTGVRAAA